MTAKFKAGSVQIAYLQKSNRIYGLDITFSRTNKITGKKTDTVVSMALNTADELLGMLKSAIEKALNAELQYIRLGDELGDD